MDIVTLAAARKGGGSGGGVTKQYVDDHLALKADKIETKEHPIASTTTGINPAITDSADGLIQDLKVYGRSHVSKNLISIVEETKEVSGVTFTIDKTAGTLTLNGTATNNFDFYPFNQLSNMPTVEYYFTIGLESAYAGIKAIGKPSYFNVNPSTTMYTSPTGMYLQITNGTSFNNLTLKPMVCLSSAGTDFEPYFSGIRGIGEDGELEITTANSDNTASATATVTTGIPLYAVGDVKDELDEKRGVVIKRCEKVVLNGSEEWYQGNPAYRFYLRKPDAKLGTNLINDAELIATTYPGGTHTICISPISNINSIDIKYDETITILNDWKTYLASNPLTVIYELAEPVEIPLTDTELSALHNLRTYNPTTNITITDAPTSTVRYLLNTDNGQAVADAIDNAITGVLNTSY